MPLNPHSILISTLLGLACVTVMPTVAAAQTAAPPRTTGSGNKPGGFVTAPTAGAAKPKPAPRKQRPKRPLREPVGVRLLSLTIGPEDYPAQLLRMSAQGRVVTRVHISASGAPTGCEIAESSGFPDLDAHSCGLIMQRAQFEPARDEYGDPVASTYQAPISWRIPE